MTYQRTILQSAQSWEFLVAVAMTPRPPYSDKRCLQPYNRNRAATGSFTPKLRFRDGLQLAITGTAHAKLDGFPAADVSRVSPDALGCSVTCRGSRTTSRRTEICTVDRCDPMWAWLTLVLPDLVERRLMMTCSSRGARSRKGCARQLGRHEDAWSCQ